MSASPPMATRGRRVAITGYGVVAPCGLGKQAFWNGLNGPSLTGGRTVEIADWDPLPYFANPKEARRADRFVSCTEQSRQQPPLRMILFGPTLVFREWFRHWFERL